MENGSAFLFSETGLLACRLHHTSNGRELIAGTREFNVGRHNQKPIGHVLCFDHTNEITKSRVYTKFANINSKDLQQRARARDKRVLCKLGLTLTGFGRE